MTHPQRSILAALTLFFVAPLVAEFLLGDFPLTWLALLIPMAPMYGGGALLIRELTRRSGRGWPTMLLLGCAYCLIEEGYTTQSLFNPNFLGMHLLRFAWIPSLGIGAWWTLFMLNVHPFWSIGVSIALVEGLFPSRARTPWLGNFGLSIAAALFAAGVWFNTYYSIHTYHFVASRPQFLITALFVVAFAAAAFLIPRPAAQKTSGSVPSPWLTGAIAFLLGVGVFLSFPIWNWGAVGSMLAVDLVFLFLLWEFSRRSGWTLLHTLSVGSGGAVFYGVHAFVGNPVVPSPKSIVLASRVLFLVLALAFIAVAVSRTRGALAASPSLTPTPTHSA